MKDFQSPPNGLRRLGPGARALYGLYLLFTALGLCSAALLHYDGLGLDAETATSWFRGNDADAYPKSFRQLAELTHFHLFTEPVALLVVSHLYALGTDPGGRRALAIGGTAAAIVLQIGLPWVVTYVTPAAGVLFLPVHAALFVGFGYMILRGAVDLWAAGREA